MGTVPTVAVSNLSKYFPQWELRRFLTGRRAAGVWALRDVEFELQPGENLTLVGPNGSGKTTLIKLIATLLVPTRGRIWVHGREVAPQSLDVRKRLGFITANEYSFYGRLSGRQNLAFFAKLHDLDPRTAIPPVARLLQLEPYLDRRFFSYSTGIKRRLDLARGLLHQPDVLLLDEPTTNLDPLTTVAVRELLSQFRDRGKTIIMVTHRLEEAEKLGGRLALMKDGRLREVRLAPGENLEDRYLREVHEGQHPQ